MAQLLWDGNAWINGKLGLLRDEPEAPLHVEHAELGELARFISTAHGGLKVEQDDSSAKIQGLARDLMPGALAINTAGGDVAIGAAASKTHVRGALQVDGELAAANGVKVGARQVINSEGMWVGEKDGFKGDKGEPGDKGDRGDKGEPVTKVIRATKVTRATKVILAQAAVVRQLGVSYSAMFLQIEQSGSDQLRDLGLGPKVWHWLLTDTAVRGRSARGSCCLVRRGCARDRQQDSYLALFAWAG